MKERPILFSTEMVKAILEGRKTQTRRVIKPQPNDIRESPFVKSGIETTHGYEIKLKYEPGDRLWVRETFVLEGDKPHYRATDPLRGCIWRPSIFMPRWASRITLEIVNIRVERVQDISEDDAIAEGATPLLVDPDGGSCPYCEGFRALWDSINAKRGYPWDSNPYVWVLEFKRIDI